jgi:hypothetical protein
MIVTLNIVTFFIGTYITPFPQALYYESNCESNLAYAGIGLGLIHAQQMFWTANSLAVVLSFAKPSAFTMVPVASVCLCLYVISILKANQLRILLNGIASRPA